MEQLDGHQILWANAHRNRYMFTLGEFDLPLYMDSVGYNPYQEPVDRSKGYPNFHWLQTLEGEGEFLLGGRRYTLPPGNGSLLFPGVPHSYAAKGGKKWSTLYVTFGGALAGSMLASLGIRHTEWLHWNDDAPITSQLVRMIEQVQKDEDRTGLNASAALYRFLTMVKIYGQKGGRSSVYQHLEKLDPLLHWLDDHYGDPEIGLPDMAEQLDISPRYLNSLFRQAFGITAYAYLIRLRIMKSKEMMSFGDNKQSIKEIAQLSGYRDSSHFIAAFGKAEGMTPEQFRKLHGLMI
ncbi:helix-turn-helix transcriptional regulator [Paenibacillus glycinis]|uniref:Helix-turn-helix domain-containing protein n=1 Tax=Paenibacillus glycinis TaxID=2697035 RepID=A0ABW9XUB8_9BACL|nr:AraC family transcriptional regulator [Paenibacillus glycinis]NBD26248.1 helix-turn-helix domain-containing protein [Paenibacillus glycinis]